MEILTKSDNRELARRYCNAAVINSHYISVNGVSLRLRTKQLFQQLNNEIY